MQSDAPKWTEHVLAQTGATAGAKQADQDAYKQLSTLVAKGTAIVSAVHRGWDNAATVTDYLSISYDPPTMVVSLYGLSRMAEALEGADRWALSILSSEQRAVADVLSEPGRPLDSLLSQIPHFRRADAAPPLIAGALGWFELRTIAMHEVATHILFVGEVVAMGRTEPTAQESAVRSPLVRFQSGYLRAG
ncbi:flavin reductase family protein [Rathayibacter soli]|uniref:flavin reductase family protein n=1 Tax=Rathayibacter soli TaxID=3144168 RepID=UPI0027E3F96B|nr:flavin reductase family protein [Glaciibacter superstes]